MRELSVREIELIAGAQNYVDPLPPAPVLPNPAPNPIVPPVRSFP